MTFMLPRPMVSSQVSVISDTVDGFFVLEDFFTWIPRPYIIRIAVSIPLPI